MSFDKPTRNKLAAMVSECRGLLTDDIRDQLQTAYGLQPDGTALPIERLAHLDDTGKEVARELREWQEHLASTEIGTEAQKKKAAFERVAHETAFTVLNRLAALRMCEERGHVIECVRRGMESDGFVLYERLSAGVFGTRSDTYRAFLEHMFDELAVDLSVLFDRRAPQSLLFPRERCLERILSLLNSQELTPLWKEDETIGWIYQYFNSREERGAMRAASAAPRNSRELAVRNQFFTPRYVVEFLVDNTLGRIWYEMRKGDTALKDVCRHLVRRPTETFLKEAERSPAASSGEKDLSQEELLKQPVHILHRPKKDPRDLKILDPACGSGHFLLYAFDLLETIYEEAWRDEQLVECNTTGKTLRDEYPDLDNLKRALPELILRHNLHGIDIDLRCCQIAALALWLRAQRAYQRLGFKSADRPKITKSNIVCAEPMPGERQFLDQFVADIQPKVLGQLVQAVFEKMKLAGEAGPLLRIEDEISEAVADAKQKWLAGPKPEQQVLFGDLRLQQTELSLDFSGITDDTFWEKAEERIYAELQNYAERAENGHGYRRRLFAEDAAQGFAFVDLCRKRYDAILMNPPFGLVPDTIFQWLQQKYADNYVDVYSSFVSRGVVLGRAGIVGTITSRSLIGSKKLQRWRENQLLHLLDLLIDLGKGVMDDANIDSCCYTLRTDRSAPPAILAFDVRSDRETLMTSLAVKDLLDTGKGFVCSRGLLRTFPGSKLLYFVSGRLSQLIVHEQRFEPAVGTVRKGLTTFDDFRFLRLRWEVNPAFISRGAIWEFFAKGGEYSTYYTDVHLLVNRANNGQELAERNIQVNGQTAQSRQGESYYYNAGCQYTGRSQAGFSARFIRPGCVMSSNAPMIISQSKTSPFYILGWLNSRLIRSVIEMQAMDNDFIPGLVKNLPWIEPTVDSASLLAEKSLTLFNKLCDFASLEETDPHFRSLIVSPALPDSLSEHLERFRKTIKDAETQILEDQQAITDAIDDIYGIDSKSLGEEVLGPNSIAEARLPSTDGGDFSCALASFLTGVAMGRWDAQFATGERNAPELPEPHIPIPTCPPGMLKNDQGLPLTQNDVERLRACNHWHYPVEIPLDGILVDDPGHPEDIVRRVREPLLVIWKERAEAIEQEACEILGVKDLREYFRKPSLFFADHLRRYSKSHRQAPIYWPLSTASGLYTLWVYYQRLNDDLLYTALNKYVKPKIDATEKELRRIESELPNATGREALSLRTAFEETTNLLEEVQEFRDELARVAELPYKPNLNDGVLISASPLWKLFRLPKWRKDLEECWNNLAAGEYDWAHLAYSIWPDRVREACRHDRSIAIAHDLEELCEVTPKPAKKKRSRKGKIEEAVLGEEG